MIDAVMIVLCSVFMALPLLVSVIILIYGKMKLKRALETVEFYPPEGFSPIDVMTEYYARHSKPKGLINPLMLYWAENGYIKIEDDCRRGLKLTKLKELEPPRNADAERLETFNLERRLFKNIFDGKVFYTLTARSAYKEDCDKFVKSVSAEAKKVTISKWALIEGLLSAFSVVSVIFSSFMLWLALEETMFLVMLFPIAALVALRFVPLGVFKYLFFALWGGAPAIAVLFNVPAAAAIIIVCSLLCSYLTQYVVLPFVDLRRPQNLKTYARLKGFKTFLVKAEKPQLEMLVEENPNYYFDILPYCYVLNITKKVREKFDKIRLDGPAPYLADSDFGDYRDRLMF